MVGCGRRRLEATVANHIRGPNWESRYGWGRMLACKIMKQTVNWVVWEGQRTHNQGRYWQKREGGTRGTRSLSMHAYTGTHWKAQGMFAAVPHVCCLVGWWELAEYNYGMAKANKHV